LFVGLVLVYYAWFVFRNYDYIPGKNPEAIVPFFINCFY